MIRKVYLDFIGSKLSKKEFHWLFSRGIQYLLTHASYFVRKPLCGPILGTLVTNYTCNYQCSMCDLKLRVQECRSKGLKELDTAQMKDILNSFAQLGASGIGFTGGEPLLRGDIFELLGHTKTLGMISHLNTNGSLLDDRNVKNILKARVDSLNISLDGAAAKTHDSIRGVQGAFDRAVEAIGRVNAMRKKKNASLRVKTVAVLQEKNIDEVQDLVGLSGELGVDCIEFIPQQPFTAGGKQTAVSSEFLTRVDRVTDYLLGLGKGTVRIENSPTHIRLFRQSFLGLPSPLKCYAGYNSYAVDCYGEIYPCVPWYNWRRPAGNVRDHDLEAFWYSPDYNRLRKEIRNCRSCYLNCQAELNILFNFGTARKA